MNVYNIVTRHFLVAPKIKSLRWQPICSHCRMVMMPSNLRAKIVGLALMGSAGTHPSLAFAMDHESHSDQSSATHAFDDAASPSSETWTNEALAVVPSKKKAPKRSQSTFQRSWLSYEQMEQRKQQAVDLLRRAANLDSIESKTGWDVSADRVDWAADKLEYADIEFEDRSDCPGAMWVDFHQKWRQNGNRIVLSDPEAGATIHVCNSMRSGKMASLNLAIQSFIHEAFHLTGIKDECVVTRSEASVMDSSHLSRHTTSYDAKCL